jgi:hypothetical protein
MSEVFKNTEGDNKSAVSHLETPADSHAAQHNDPGHHHHGQVEADAALKALGDVHQRVQMTHEQASRPFLYIACVPRLLTKCNNDVVAERNRQAQD